MRSLPLLLLTLAASLAAAESYPLWDGKESVADYAKKVNLPTTQSLDLGNGVKMDLVLIPAGTFIMGTPEPTPVDEAAFQKKILTGQVLFAVNIIALLVLLSVVFIRAIRQKQRPQVSLGRLLLITITASGCVLGYQHWHHSIYALEKAMADYIAEQTQYKNAADEKPAHQVTITQPFYMAKYEVTQEQYQSVIGANPSYLKGNDKPVHFVTWNDAQVVCQKLTDQTTQSIRLPTEAEWEFACRAGTTTDFYSGNTESDLDRVAWHWENSNKTLHPVGLKDANAFGLYDMHGNVWEWCSDVYEIYSPEPVRDPRSAISSLHYVLRGGSWYDDPVNCRAANRDYTGPQDGRTSNFGFRVVVNAPSRTP